MEVIHDALKIREQSYFYGGVNMSSTISIKGVLLGRRVQLALCELRDVHCLAGSEWGQSILVG